MINVALLWLILQSGVPVVNGQAPATACMVAHQDQPINTAVTVNIPAPPSSALYVYICGIDLTVSADATGAVAQTNVQWTATNLAWKYTYSTTSTLNTTPIDRSFVFVNPIRATSQSAPVTISSPAANAHNVYSINVYYRYGY